MASSGDVRVGTAGAASSRLVVPAFRGVVISRPVAGSHDLSASDSKASKEVGTRYWSIGIFPDRLMDSLMHADGSSEVDERLQPAIPVYDTHDEFGLVESWDPGTTLACDSGKIWRDATAGPVTRPVVSDRLRQLIDRLAPDHAHWLPITLVHRRKPMPWGPYWVANWTRKVDCWNLAAGERRMLDEYRQRHGVEPLKGKPLPRG